MFTLLKKNFKYPNRQNKKNENSIDVIFMILLNKQLMHKIYLYTIFFSSICLNRKYTQKSGTKLNILRQGRFVCKKKHTD